MRKASEERASDAEANDPEARRSVSDSRDGRIEGANEFHSKADALRFIPINRVGNLRSKLSCKGVT
jgi:hypothetical protein